MKHRLMNFNDIVNGNEAFSRYHHFVSEGKVNRLINDMIYFVRDTIMNKTINEQTSYDALTQFDLETLYHIC